MSNPRTTTGALTTSGQISASHGIVFGFDLLPPASGTATLKLYDGTDNTGRLISTAEASSKGNSVHVNFPHSRPFQHGLYVELVGTASYVVALCP